MMLLALIVSTDVGRPLSLLSSKSFTTMLDCISLGLQPWYVSESTVVLSQYGLSYVEKPHQESDNIEPVALCL